MNESSGISQALRPLNDVLQEHLTGCRQCQEATQGKPIGNLAGQTCRLCSEWFRIIREWADKEGEVNNVVAHDEYGNPAGRSSGSV